MSGFFRSNCVIFNPSADAMPTNNYCNSLDLDLDLPLRVLFGRCSRKRARRMSSEATNPPPQICKIGDDLLVEILIRSFPDPGAACRCKVVCKHWSSLISSPCFNRRFVMNARAQQQPPMPANPNDLKTIIMSVLPPMPNRRGGTLRVLDCFKDLVLCGFPDWDSPSGGDENRETSRSFLICNPFTKQWMALPLAPKKADKFHPFQGTKFVWEPRITNNLDLGDDDQPFVYHQYRFRVVCLYQEGYSIKLDVFCSESGEWIKRPLVLGQLILKGTVLSCNGELFWYCWDGAKNFVAAINPFHLNKPLTRIDLPPALSALTISISQGALHLISYGYLWQTQPLHPVVWRLEQDRKSWRKQCEWFLKDPRCCSHESNYSFGPFLHPHNPEIVFFRCTGCATTLFSYDLARKEMESFAEIQHRAGPRLFVEVFEPRVCCWPTPIPRYKQLRGLYDGSYSLWVQDTIEATTPSLDNLNKTTTKLLS